MISVRYTRASDSAYNLLVLAKQINTAVRRRASHELIAARQRAAIYVQGVRERARQSGYQAGLEASKEELREELLAYQERYQAALQDVQKECLDLVCAIAEEVLGRAVQEDREALAKRVVKALGEVVDRRSLTLTVNPADGDSIDAALQEQWPEGSYTICRSPGIEVGNACIKTVAGTLELNWREHLAALRKQLRRYVPSAGTA